MFSLPPPRIIADRGQPDGADVRATGWRARMAWRHGGSRAEEGTSGGGDEGTRGDKELRKQGEGPVPEVIVNKRWKWLHTENHSRSLMIFTVNTIRVGHGSSPYLSTTVNVDNTW